MKVPRAKLFSIFRANLEFSCYSALIRKLRINISHEQKYIFNLRRVQRGSCVSLLAKLRSLQFPEHKEIDTWPVLRLQRGTSWRSRDLCGVENFYRRLQARRANPDRFARERQNNKERNRENTRVCNYFIVLRDVNERARQLCVSESHKAKSASERALSAQAQLILISRS